MDSSDALKQEIKELLVSNLMLPVAVEAIGDDTPLFDPTGLGLDSVDALQLVVALEKNYGLKVPDPATARKILASVNSITEAVAAHKSAASL